MQAPTGKPADFESKQVLFMKNKQLAYLAKSADLYGTDFSMLSDLMCIKEEFPIKFCNNFESYSVPITILRFNPVLAQHKHHGGIL
jgi:hypothetical protein